MRRLLAVAAIVVTAALAAAPASAVNGHGVSCAMGYSTPGYLYVTINGILTQPGYVTSAEIHPPSGVPETDPYAVDFGKLSKGAPTTGTLNVQYFGPGLYIADLFAINDKTGNGSGDGSGDQYTLIAADACSVTLP